MSAREFANERLFRPLGIEEIPDREMTSFRNEDVFGKNVSGWIKDPGGVTTGGWGLTMTPRDMARFGFLYLNRGRWDGQQIVPAAWIAESTAPNPNDYGYYWWLRGSGRDVLVLGRWVRWQLDLLRSGTGSRGSDRRQGGPEVSRSLAARRAVHPPGHP